MASVHALQPAVVSQEDLHHLVAIRNQIAYMQDVLAAQSALIRDRLQRGATVEPGCHFAHLVTRGKGPVSTTRLAIDGRIL